MFQVMKVQCKRDFAGDDAEAVDAKTNLSFRVPTFEMQRNTKRKFKNLACRMIPEP